MDLNTIITILKEMFATYADRLSLAEFMPSIILAVAGLSSIFLARRITRVIKRKNNIDNEDKFMLGVKFFGLIVFFVAILIIVLQSL